MTPICQTNIIQEAPLMLRGQHCRNIKGEPQIYGSLANPRPRPFSSNLACSWGLPRPIIKSHPEEKWAWPWARELFKNLGFPYSISATAGASEFKFGMQLGLAKVHHKITRRRKVEVDLGQGSFQITVWGFPFNIYTMVEASDFKFGTQAHRKITPIKSGPVL